MPPKPVPTHFLCIPLVGSQLVRSLAAFRADVTTDHGASLAGYGIGAGTATAAIPDKAVRPPGTLHLTLGVMSLRDDSVSKAVDLLKTTRLSEILDGVRTASAEGFKTVSPGTLQETNINEQQLSITLRGLNAMQSPSKTTVLYVPPDDPQLLLRRFCEALKSKFTDAGLMTPEDRPLLLHATVVNTIYVKGKDGRRRGGGGGKSRERLSLDARDILDRYEGHVWLEGMPVDRVRLCRMGAKKLEPGEGVEEGDEAYEVEAEVTF